MHTQGHIFGYFVSNSTSKTKVLESGPSMSITHLDNLKKHFPGADFSIPD